jgi:hypothetical protein
MAATPPSIPSLRTWKPVWRRPRRLVGYDTYADSVWSRWKKTSVSTYSASPILRYDTKTVEVELKKSVNAEKLSYREQPLSWSAVFLQNGWG